MQWIRIYKEEEMTQERCFKETYKQLLSRGTTIDKVIVSLILGTSNCYCDECKVFGKKYYSHNMNNKIIDFIYKKVLKE